MLVVAGSKVDNPAPANSPNFRVSDHSTFGHKPHLGFDGQSARRVEVAQHPHALHEMVSVDKEIEI